MAKYNKRIVKQITDLIKRDSYTVVELCSMAGIAVSTFYDWQESKPEFLEAIKKARGEFDEILVQEAKNSLRKLINGYDADEKKTVYVNDKDGKPKIKEQTTIKKHFQPNVAATIFLLTNKAAEEYKNRQNNELTGKDGKDLFAALSDEELNAKIAELEAKLNSK